MDMFTKDFYFLMTQHVKEFSLDNIIRYEKQYNVKLNHNIISQVRKSYIKVSTKEEIIAVANILNANYFVTKNALIHMHEYNMPLCFKIGGFNKATFATYETALEELEKDEKIFEYTELFC